MGARRSDARACALRSGPSVASSACQTNPRTGLCERQQGRGIGGRTGRPRQARNSHRARAEWGRPRLACRAARRGGALSLRARPHLTLPYPRRPQAQAAEEGARGGRGGGRQRAGGLAGRRAHAAPPAARRAQGQHAAAARLCAVRPPVRPQPARPGARTAGQPSPAPYSDETACAAAARGQAMIEAVPTSAGAQAQALCKPAAAGAAARRAAARPLGRCPGPGATDCAEPRARSWREGVG